MACRVKDNGVVSAVELIAERGLEGLPEALTVLINTAMQLERERHLGVGAYERGEQRRGYANGYKPKTVKSRVGELTLAVPQVREGGFYPQSLEKGLRYVYTGNVHDRAGASTWCHGCGDLLIERDWHALGHWGLDDAGRCRNCGTAVPGRFAGPPRQAVSRPLRVRFA